MKKRMLGMSLLSLVLFTGCGANTVLECSVTEETEYSTASSVMKLSYDDVEKAPVEAYLAMEVSVTKESEDSWDITLMQTFLDNFEEMYKDTDGIEVTTSSDDSSYKLEMEIDVDNFVPSEMDEFETEFTANDTLESMQADLEKEGYSCTVK